MTRINTNVSSLVAQKNLGRSNADLNVTLTRLSTGLRINSGKDDPAGLIASESLRSDITSVEKAITNSERANQLIATADSALGQVSSLLNDIRGLISEAANTGALSDEQVAANQLQIDSSLEAIDRIAQVTSFQGKRLLDGNLDFITQNVNRSSIAGLQIDQANFGTQTSIGVAVKVVSQATRGTLNYGFGAVADDLILEVGGANGTEAFNFAKGSTIEEIASAVNLVSDATGVEAVLETAATKGELTVSSFGKDNDILLTANEAGFEPGDVRIKYAKGTSSTTTATYTAQVGDDPAKLEVTLGVTEYETASVTVDTAGTDNDFSITANQAGADFNDISIIFNDGAITGQETAVFDADAKTLTITKNAASTGADIIAAINSTSPLSNTPFAIVDGAAVNSDFSITSDSTGLANNNTTINFIGGGTAGAETVAYDNSDPDAPIITVTIQDGVSTANQVISAINLDGVTGPLFTAAANVAGSDGSGVIAIGDSGAVTTTANNSGVSALFTAALVETLGSGSGAVAFTGTFGTTTSGGVDGGDVSATANDVIEAINAAVGNTTVTASLAAGNDGHDAVTEFTNFAYNGVPEQNTSLQFLAPEDSPNIRFVSNAGTELSIDTTTDPRVEGVSQAIIQNADPDGTFSIIAKLKGTDYDGYSISFVDDATVTGGANEFGVLDKENKTLTIHLEDGVSTAEDLLTAINDDAYISQFFEAKNFGSSDGSDAVTIADLTIPAATTGGLVSEGTLVVNLETDADGNIKTTANDLIAFFDDPSAFISDPTHAANALAYLEARGISVTNVEGSDGTGVLEVTADDIAFATSGNDLEDAQASGSTYAVNGANAQLSFTAVNSGEEYDNVTVRFVNDATVTAGVNERGEYEAATKTLTFFIEAGTTSADDIADIFDSLDANYNEDLAQLFSTTSGGAGLVTTDDTATLTGGVVDNGTTDGAALIGNSDLENLGLTFQATNFGSDSFVSVKALSGAFSLADQSGATNVDRASGTDVDVRINGIQAIGAGLKASINTSSLDLSFTLSASVESNSSFEFEIVGGGALFQLGPDVVSNQQARLGIQSVSTATLGGVSGRLFELRSGGSKSLTNDVGGAAKVVDEVISVVTSLRGRLGAFQKTTLDSNIYSLNDTLANLTEAESSIRDADFAAESARLTRAQILVQAGTNTLGIANQNPQNVLSLLQG
ncbi:flagellin [Blastopirellula sp. J2-11]|uniref:flagellin N-terminal helical domain-containing protein n=1 Tax=Blastopirellula sp. J2-11 TaxID=2943192 RepID=UPI0021CA3BFF|nr:flagellin [Blastopirellula sp. J2-11]UUO09003.1 flagellin [Blastopirellula sp. J2-11]